MRALLTAALLTATPLIGDDMPGTFVQNLRQLMPPEVTLSPELVTTFDWMEDQGWLHIRGDGAPEDHYLSIYPADLFAEPNASFVTFGGTSLSYTGHWSTPDADVDSRIVEIATTSGDGGRAAIWVDDAGAQWFVHLGHDTLGVISDDPLVLLQWLAMGYVEPGAMEITDITPLEQAMAFNGMEDPADLHADERPLKPDDFQAFLKTEFGVTPPPTAHDLGIAEFAYYGDETSTDPFVKWMIAVTPPPTEEELAYIRELEKIGSNMEQFTIDDQPKRTFLQRLLGLKGSNN